MVRLKIPKRILRLPTINRFPLRLNKLFGSLFRVVGVAYKYSLQPVVRFLSRDPWRKPTQVVATLAMVIGSGVVVYYLTQGAAALVQPAGRLFYGDDTNTALRFQTNTFDFTFNGEVSFTHGASSSLIAHTVSKTAPTRDEVMVGSLKVDGQLQVVKGINGYDVNTDYALAWTNSGATGAQTCNSGTQADCTRAFDIEYEQLSGRAMVVYADTTNQKLYYCYWDGTNWGPQSACTPSNGTNDISLTANGRPTRVSLKSLPGSDKILMGVSIDVAGTHEVEAYIWSGSAWGTSLNATGTNNASASALESGATFDVAWENLSGEAMIVFGRSGGSGATSYYLTASGSWGSEQTGPTSVGSNGTMMTMSLDSDPVSNRILYNYTDDASDSAPGVWKADGSTVGWTMGNEDASLENNDTGTWVSDAIWENDGSEALWVAHDAGTTVDTLDQTITCDGTGCTFGSIGATMPTRGPDDGVNISLYRSNNSDDIMALWSDIDRELSWQHWDGSAWEAAAGGGTESLLSPGTAESTQFHGISSSFNYVPYAPWSRNWRFYDDETSNDPSTGLNSAAENATPTSVDVDEFIRLRMNVANLQPQAQTDSRKKLQYTSGCTPNSANGEAGCTWTDVGDTSETTAVWRYASRTADGAAVCADASHCDDNQTFTTARLTGTTQNGSYITDKDAAGGSNMDHNASAIVEYDFPLKAEAVAGNTTYYFRMYDIDQSMAIYREQDNDGANDCASATCTYPSLTTTAIPFTGTVYMANGTTPATTGNGGPCDGSTAVIAIRANGGTADTGSCSATDGTFSITQTNVALSNGAELAVYLTSSMKANSIFLSDGVTQSGLNLYENRVMVSHHGAGPQTIVGMDAYDNDQNATDMLYDAEDATPDTLVVESGNVLRVESSKTFTPGGTVSTPNLNLRGTLTATSTTITISGSGTGSSRPLIVDSGSFSSTGTVVFSGTSAVEIDLGASFPALHLLPVSGSPTYTAGTASSQTLTVQGNLYIGDGTQAVTFNTSTYNPAIHLTGDLRLCDVTCTTPISYSAGAGTFRFNPVGTANWDDYNATKQNIGSVQIGGGSSTPTVTNANTNILANSMTIDASHTLTLGSPNVMELVGTTGTIFTRNGTFNGASGTVKFSSDASVTLTNNTSFTFGGLQFGPTITANRAYTFGTGTISASSFTANSSAASAYTLTINLGGALTVTGSTIASMSGSGAGPSTTRVDTTSSNHAFTAAAFSISTNGELKANGSTITCTSTSTTCITLNVSGNFIADTSTFTVTGNGTKTITTSDFTGADAFYNFTISPALSASSVITHTLTSGGDIEINGDLNITPTASGASAKLTVIFSSSGTAVVASNKTTTINAGDTNSPEVQFNMPTTGTSTSFSTGYIVVGDATGGNDILYGQAAGAFLILTGTSGTLFTVDGTFTENTTSEIIVKSNGSPTINANNAESSTFYHLELSPALTADRTYTFGTNALTVSGSFQQVPTGAFTLTTQLGASTTFASTQDHYLGGGVLDTTTSNHSLSTGRFYHQAGELKGNGSTITLNGTQNPLYDFSGGAIFTAGTSTLRVASTASRTVFSGANFTGSNSLYNFTIDPALTGGITHTIGSLTLNINGDFSLTPTSAGANSLTVSMGGNITVASGKTTTINADDTNSPTVRLDTRPSTTDYNLTTGFLVLGDATGGTDTLDAGSSASVITLTGTSGTLFTRGGTFTPGSSEVVVTSASGSPTLLSAATTFHKLTINSAATKINAGQAISTTASTCSEAVTISQGTLDDGGYQINDGGCGTFTMSANTTLILGNATATQFPTTFVYSSIFLDDTSTVIYNSTSNQVISPDPVYGNVQLSAASGAPIKTYADIFIDGDLTIDANNTLKPNVTGFIELKGDFINNGTFDADVSEVLLNGTTKQTLSGSMTGASAFYDLTITNASGTAPSDNEITGFVPSVDFDAAATVTNNFEAITASTKIQFNNGSTYTFNNININGQAGGTLIYLRNSAASGAWYMNVSGTQTAVSYVNVSRSDASGGDPINSDATDVDAGNTVNWFDSAISGVIYMANGTTPATTGNSGPCDGSTTVISVRVDGGTAETTTCSATDATFTITLSSLPTAGQTVAFYLTSSMKANTIYTSDGSGDTGIELIENRVIVRHENAGPLTIVDMIDYDNDQNATDMLFDAEDSTPDTLTMEAGTELHINTGDTFTPGGTVNAVNVRVVGTMSMGANPLNISGDYTNSGVFTAGTSVTTFTATSAGKNLSGTMTGSSKFYDLVFNGVGGEWTTNAAVETGNDYTVTNGSVIAGNNNATVTRDFTLANTVDVSYTAGSSTIAVSRHYNDTGGKLVAGTSTLTMNGTGTMDISNAFQFYNLNVAYTGFTTTMDASIQTRISNDMTLNGGTMTGSSSAVEFMISATNTPLTFNAATTINGSGFNYFTFGTQASSVVSTITGGNYGSWPIFATYSANNSTHQIGGAVTATHLRVYTGSPTGCAFNTQGNTLNLGSFQLGSGGATVAFDTNLGTSTITLTDSGDAFYPEGSGGTYPVNLASSHIISLGNVKFASGSGAVTTTAGTSTIEWRHTSGTKTFAPNGQSLYNLVMNGAGGTLQPNAAVDVNNDFSVINGTYDVVSGSNYALTVGGSFGNSATFNAQSGTVTFDGTTTGHVIRGTLTGSSSFYNLTFNGSGGEWTALHDIEVDNDLTMTAGTLLGTINLTVAGGDMSGNGTILLTGEGSEYFTGATKVALANLTSCAITLDGAAYCWGSYDAGTIGNGSRDRDSLIPTRVVKGAAVSGDHDGTYLDNVTDITVGTQAACAVTSAANIYCWGTESSGAVGNGSTSTIQNSPVRVLKGAADAADNDGTYLDNIAQVSTNSSHTCAVSVGGNVYCWGDESFGKLGNGATASVQSSPVRVLKGASDAADNDGTYLDNIAQVTTGSAHTCAASIGGNAYCWGATSSGQVGNASTNPNVSSPVRVVKGAADAADNDGTYLDNIESLTGGTSHTCAVSVGGNAYCWGDAGNGRLGNNTTSPNQSSPVRVLKGAADAADHDSTNLVNISKISAGVLHTCAISTGGNTYCWGSATAGSLGNGTTSPNVLTPGRVLKGLADVADNDGTYLTNSVDISANSSFACAVSNGGNTYCWGNGSRGQQGIGTIGSQTSPVRVILETSNTYFRNASQTDAGSGLVCSVTSPLGSVYCWGYASLGELGNGTTSPTKYFPVRVVKGAAAASDTDGTYLTNIRSVTATSYGYACAVAVSGNVYCWGTDGSGQLGNGATTGDQSSPVRVVKGGATSYDNDGTYLTNAKSISASNEHVCVVSNSGSAYCWGLASSGRLGNGTTTPDVTSPVQVVKGAAATGDHDGTYLANVTSISTGSLHTCAVTASTNLYCWGDATAGKLGNGSTSPAQSSPVRVLKGAADAADNDGTYLDNIAVVSAGDGHTCVASIAENAYCWGDASYGRLGNNSTSPNQSSPVRVLKGAAVAADNDSTNLTNITSIAAGYIHTCAVSAATNVYCWGGDDEGELGQGTWASEQHTPVRVLKGSADTADNDGTYLDNAVHVSVPDTFGAACARSAGGNIYCWGSTHPGNGLRDSNNIPHRTKSDDPIFISPKVATLTGTGNFGGTSAWGFVSLTFGAGASGTTTASGTSDITVSDTMTVYSSQTLSAGSKTYVLTDAGTPLVVAGTFTPGTSTVEYAGSETQYITNGISFYNLDLSSAASKYLSGTTTATNDLTIATGATLDVTTSNYGLSIGGNYSNSGTFTARNGTVTLTDTGTQSISGTMTGSSAFYNLTLNGSGGTVTPAAAVDVNNDFTITAGTYDTVNGSNYALSVGGNYSNSGTFTARAGTVTFDATDSGNTISGTLNGTSSFYKVVFNGTGGAWTIQNAITATADANDTFKVSAGTVTLGNGTGDNLEVRGQLLVATTANETATFQTAAVAEGSSITIDINQNNGGSPTTCTNCGITVGASSGSGQGNLKLAKNTVLRLNPRTDTATDIGLVVQSTGYLEVLGAQDYTGTVTAASDTSITDSGKTWTTDENNGKHMRMTSGFAEGLIFPITDTTSTQLLRTTTTSEESTVTVVGSGKTREICASKDTLITADNEEAGRILYDSTTDTYFQIVKSVNDEGSSCSSNDQFTVIENGDSFSSLNDGDNFVISDGIQPGDTYEVLDFANITAESGTACTSQVNEAGKGEAYVQSASGSQTLLRYADICNLGRFSATTKYGLYATTTDASLSNNGYTIDTVRNRGSLLGHYNTTGLNMSISDFTVSGTTFEGISMVNTGRSSLSDLRISQAGDIGIGITGVGNNVTDIFATRNGSSGVSITTASSTFTDISSFGNDASGLSLTSSADESALRTVRSSGNVGSGISMSTADNNALIDVESYANAQGIGTGQSVGVTVINSTFSNNTTADINVGSVAAGVHLYNTSLLSSTPVANASHASAFVISRKHDTIAGATKIWGKYAVQAENTNTPQSEATDNFSYAKNLWEKSTNAPGYYGTGTEDTSLDIDTSGTDLSGGPYIYQLVAQAGGTANCATPTVFNVLRNGTDVGDATCGIQFTDTTGGVNLKFKVDGGASAYVQGDAYTFAAYNADNSTNTAKSVTLMQDGDTITVGSGKTLEAKGVSGNATTFTRGATGGWHMSVAGTIALQNFTMSYLGGTSGAAGLDLQSGATVTTLANGTFNNFQSVGASDTFVTIHGSLIGTGTPAKILSNITFTQATAEPEYSVTVAGGSPSTGNFWTIYPVTCTGWASCEASDSDTGDGAGAPNADGFLRFLQADLVSGRVEGGTIRVPGGTVRVE